MFSYFVLKKLPLPIWGIHQGAVRISVHFPGFPPQSTRKGLYLIQIQSSRTPHPAPCTQNHEP